jgi:hypothetical protein
VKHSFRAGDLLIDVFTTDQSDKFTVTVSSDDPTQASYTETMHIYDEPGPISPEEVAEIARTSLWILINDTAAWLNDAFSDEGAAVNEIADNVAAVLNLVFLYEPCAFRICLHAPLIKIGGH